MRYRATVNIIITWAIERTGIRTTAFGFMSVHSKSVSVINKVVSGYSKALA
jgi:hypothetical protein